MKFTIDDIILILKKPSHLTLIGISIVVTKIERQLQNPPMSSIAHPTPAHPRVGVTVIERQLQNPPMSSIAHPTLAHPRVGVTVSPVVAGTQLGTVFPVVERFTAFSTVFSLKPCNQSTLCSPCNYTTSLHWFNLTITQPVFINFTSQLYNQSTLISPNNYTTSLKKFHLSIIQPVYN